MNPDAIRHYIRWLSRRWSPLPFYLAFASVTALTLLFLTQLGPATTANVGIARLVIADFIPILAGAILAAAVYLGTRLGGWMLFARLEAASEHRYRDVWHELMTKYRGLRPDIVDSERFRRMMLRLCEQISRSEELTPQQEIWIGQLMTLAAEKSKSDGPSRISEIGMKHGQRILAFCLGTVVVLNLFRLLLWLLGQ